MKYFVLVLAALAVPLLAPAQTAPVGKPISADLFGVFFEDISYAADGGLSAELVQSRSFAYAPSDHSGWHCLHEGYPMGSISVESTDSFQKGLGLSVWLDFAKNASSASC